MIGRTPPVLFILALCVLNGCSDKSEPGEELEEVGVVIENGGPPFEITEPGHPYQGLKLSIPMGTFEGASEWAFAVVTDPDLPELPPGFSISGPLLQIRTDQLRGANLMTLDVPVTRTDGAQVVIAFYDPARRIFEVLPKVSETESSVRVVTTHLRPDLLLGPRSATTAQPLRSLASGFVSGGPPPGYIAPVNLWMPLDEWLELMAPIGRWPVVDHGSGPLPEGSALTIAGFEALGTPSPPPFSALGTPGFYSDAAPLAATVTPFDELYVMMVRILGQTGTARAQSPKAEADELDHQTVVANLGLTQLPTPLAVMSGPEGPRTFVNAVAGTASSLRVLNPASSAPLVLNRVTATGFAAVSMLKTAGEPPITVDQIRPLPSFLFPFERLTPLLQALEEMADDAKRKAINASLSEAAGLPDFYVEVRIDPGSPWVRVDGEDVILRDETSELRVTPEYLSEFMVHGPDGALVADSVGGPLPATAVTGLTEALVDHSVSIVQRFGTRRLQAGVMNFRFAKAPLKVTPETHPLSAGTTEVTFEASFAHPPAGGFRLKWEWGDGESSEVANLTSASHTYDAPGNYSVKVTLLSAQSGQPLGTQTAKVQAGMMPYWRIDTFSDTDGLYEDYVGPADAFQRMLTSPQSGMLAVTETSPGVSSLDLKVLNAGSWDATVCCPPVGQGQLHVMNLGKTPSSQEALGPYFSAWATNSWTQSTTDLASGTLTGQAIQGTVTYTIPSHGSQLGPAGHVRLEATRNGSTLTGTFFVTIWFVDDDTGELDVAETYPFPFTATRMR